MFTKKPDKDTSALDLARANTPPIPPPMPAAPTMGRGPATGRPSGQAASVIGADLVIIGNLVSRGQVQVDGELQGDLHAVSVVVGEQARITGGVIADEVIVRGTVMGSVRGKTVALQSTSKVEGDVYHQSLSIEQGAYFEGKSRRSDDPLAGATRPDVSGLNGAHAPAAPATQSV